MGDPPVGLPAPFPLARASSLSDTEKSASTPTSTTARRRSIALHSLTVRPSRTLGMISRAAFARCGRHTLQKQSRGPSCRCLATAASGTYSYETGEAAGVKFASRDLPGPTTHVAVVAKAGTRYEPLPGFSDGLEKFAFKNTAKRSSLRITRESELLGGELSAYHSRENLVISAKFLREDLPYFTELLGEVISQTNYADHELHEEVDPVLELARKTLLSSSSEFAKNSVHGVAFHRGLGNPLHPASQTPIKKYISGDGLKAYSKFAFAKPNFAVVANGANHQDFSKWVDQFFLQSPATKSADIPETGTSATKYYGGEERIAFDRGNTLIVAFPGSGSFTGGSWKPELAVLATLLGGQTTIKWSPGFSLLSKATESFPLAHISTTHHTYSDAGLLTVEITGKGEQVADASFEIVKALKSVASGNVSAEEVKKAVATTKFQALESGQNISTGIELTGAGLVQGGKAYQLDEVGKSIGAVTEEQVKKVAKTLLDGKASVSAVGDLYLLPFAEELGLKV